MHASISDFLLDIVENSIEADSASMIVDLIENRTLLEVFVSDNGRGMDKETLKKIEDPVYTDGKKHRKRTVGLGIPFLKQAVEAVNGKFDIQSEPGMGTSIHFQFDLSHIDCPPLGNLPTAFLSMMLFDGDYKLTINRCYDEEKYSVSRTELIETVGELSSADSLILTKKYITSLEEDIFP